LVLCFNHIPPYPLSADDMDEINEALENGGSPDDVHLYFRGLLDTSQKNI